MRRHFSSVVTGAVLSAATVVAPLGLSGCSGNEHRVTSTAEPPLTSASAAAGQTAAPLPPPEALISVLYRLADPGVPGIAKLNLVEGATPEHAPTIDAFANALLENGYAPMQIEVRDIAWSDVDPGYVVATVKVTTPKPGATNMFMFPMEFKQARGDWELSERTARMLLAVASPQFTSPTPPR
jgi:hypothetical protein